MSAPHNEEVKAVAAKAAYRETLVSYRASGLIWSPPPAWRLLPADMQKHARCVLAELRRQAGINASLWEAVANG